MLQMGKLGPQQGGDLLQVPEPVLQAARLGVRVPGTLDVFLAPLDHFASKMQEPSYQERLQIPSMSAAGLLLPGLSLSEPGETLIKLTSQLMEGSGTCRLGKALQMMTADLLWSEACSGAPGGKVKTWQLSPSEELLQRRE